MKRTVMDGLVYSWESQACQFPKTGPIGFSFQRNYVIGQPVECLTYRTGRKGTLVGILYRYPEGAWEPGGIMGPIILEKPGNVNVFVHPGFRGRGVGTGLVALATWLWGPLPYRQFRFTEEGLSLAVKFDPELAVLFDQTAEKV